MKKSEYERDLRRRYAARPEAVLREMFSEADRLVIWDPEEPELPGRVTRGLLSNGDAFIFDSRSGSILLMAPQRATDQFSVAVVALWNAWGPEGSARKRAEISVRGFPSLEDLLVRPWEK